MISIRAATRADVPGIVACLADAFVPYRNEYTDGAWRDTVVTEETMAGRLETMSVVVALDPHGTVVGTIGYRVLPGGEGHLRGMAVRPPWHGRGVAESLLDWAEAALSAEGCTKVTLNTTLPLVRALRFWEKHGYGPAGRVSDFHGMEITEMVKHLPRGSRGRAGR